MARRQAITYRFWAATLDIELDGVEVAAEGDLDVRGFFGFDDGVRPGFTSVRLEITPTGPETAARYQQLADAVDAHCPVLDLLANRRHLQGDGQRHGCERSTPVRRTVAVPA